MTENKLTLEAAENEFQRFADEWTIDANVDAMTADSKEDFEGFKKRMTNGIMTGRMTIDEAGDPHLILRKPAGEVTEFHFNLPDGAVFTMFDEYKDGQSMRKMFAVIAAMVKQPPAIMAKLDGRDIKDCQMVFSLFFAS